MTVEEQQEDFMKNISEVIGETGAKMLGSLSVTQFDKPFQELDLKVKQAMYLSFSIGKILGQVEISNNPDLYKSKYPVGENSD